jgi:MoxR-like ATPase
VTIGTPAGLGEAFGVYERLKARLGAAVRGRSEVIDLVLVALLADGHVLLEDHPGSGKTTLARALGESIEGASAGAEEGEIAGFRRIQFTPDLLPSDVTGGSIFDPVTGRFAFRQGPIFAHVVLADEINRTSPKVQAAMLEAMAEKQVTIDNRTRPLDPLFFVIATQNPFDLAGTFPLPTAQLDRFLFRISMGHIERAAELEVLARLCEPAASDAAHLRGATRGELLGARSAIAAGIHVARQVQECLVDLAQATRNDENILRGASTRSLVLLLPALRARALIAGRDYVGADDIAALAPHVLGHRLELSPSVQDPPALISRCLAGPLERLARATLRR